MGGQGGCNVTVQDFDAGDLGSHPKSGVWFGSGDKSTVVHGRCRCQFSSEPTCLDFFNNNNNNTFFLNLFFSGWSRGKRRVEVTKALVE